MDEDGISRIPNIDQGFLDWRCGPGHNFRFAGHDICPCDRNGVVGSALVRFQPELEQMALEAALGLNCDRTLAQKDHRLDSYVYYAVLRAWI